MDTKFQNLNSKFRKEYIIYKFKLVLKAGSKWRKHPGIEMLKERGQLFKKKIKIWDQTESRLGSLLRKDRNLCHLHKNILYNTRIT